MLAGGSPPHARGRRHPRRDKPVKSRITPACAGKTPACFASMLNCWDHPRMREEDFRGFRRKLQNGGITPACAGKTDRYKASTKMQADHPRMRGEDRFFLCFRAESQGSPPHARGRPSHLLCGMLSHRITPACAGKTRSAHRESRRRRDHPRMRGEDYSYRCYINVLYGSPPHARGRRSKRL